MKIKLIPIESITPYARNPRKNEGLPVSKVKASLKEFGWQQPIVVDKDMVIVVGHTRYAAALELGMKEVPVHIADNLTPTQIKAYRIADNRTGSEAQWDMELLSLEFEELKAENFDLDLTGFDAAELDQVLGDPVDDPMAEWQDMPEFQQEDKMSFRDIKVHFSSQAHIDEFAKLLQQTITDKTKYVWYPKQIKDELVSLGYVAKE